MARRRQQALHVRPSGAFEGILDTQRAFLRRFARSARRWPSPLLSALNVLTSPHPLYDLSLLIWLCFGASVPFIGYRHLWTFLSNFGVVWVGNLVGDARVPRDIDPSLKSGAQVSSRGFPVVELHMAVVVFFDLAVHLNSVGAWIASTLMVSVLVFLRIYKTSYFPTHMLTSLLTGGLGLATARHIAFTYFQRRIAPGFKLLFAFVAIAMFIGFVALKVESNDTPFMRVPKHEYMRVLGGIMDQDETVASEDTTADRRSTKGKRDSFVQLMRSMRRRALVERGVEDVAAEASTRTAPTSTARASRSR